MKYSNSTSQSGFTLNVSQRNHILQLFQWEMPGIIGLRNTPYSFTQYNLLRQIRSGLGIYATIDLL